MKRSLLSLFLLLLVACGGKDATGPEQSYDVAGVITRLPSGAGTELMIRHDEIPDFVNRAGEAVGMKAMVMGFPVADSVDLSSFAEGDSVHFTFVVRWGQPKPLELTRMEKR
jgi:Cu/Ag efflux protein CusF